MRCRSLDVRALVLSAGRPPVNVTRTSPRPGGHSPHLMSILFGRFSSRVILMSFAKQLLFKTAPPPGQLGPVGVVCE